VTIRLPVSSDGEPDDAAEIAAALAMHGDRAGGPAARDAAVLPRLRDERDRRARAARRAGRAQAVHKRVLYAMYDGGYRPDRGYNKCSRVVGDVMGKYHPHGDSSIYDALVRLVQDWSMRYPLIGGQGNFGSPGNDPAAAPVHRVPDAPLAMEMVRDIDEGTVDSGTTTTARTRSR